MMRILADENCDSILIERLRAAGHDVKRMADVFPGAADADVLREAIDDDRMLLTYDMDFGLLSERTARLPRAIVLMRLDPLRAALRAEIVVNVLAQVGADCRGKFFVIEPGNVRERSIGGPE